MARRILALALGLTLAAVPLGAAASGGTVFEPETAQALAVVDDEAPEESLELLKPDEDVEAAPVIASLGDSLPAKSAILLEQQTGKVLYEQNADEQLPPASVTKIMTLLLVMEALEKGKINLDDMVTTSEYANSMGGSQIWLKIGRASCRERV